MDMKQSKSKSEFETLASQLTQYIEYLRTTDYSDDAKLSVLRGFMLHLDGGVKLIEDLEEEHFEDED